MANDPDRSHGPFLALLAIAFIIGLILVFGPGILRQGANQLPLGGARIGGFDPLQAIVNALDSLGHAISGFISGIGR